MYPILFKQEETSHPLQALCPWLDFVTDSLVLNKDGSILAAFDYRGLDPDNLSEYSVLSATEQIQTSFAQLDDRLTAWWIIDKRRDYTYLDNEFDNAVAQAVDDAYSKGFKNGKHYSLRYTLYLLYTGNTGAFKFLDRVQGIQSEEQVGLLTAISKAIKESLSGKAAFAFSEGALRDNIFSFESILTTFTNSAPLTFQRLEGDHFASALATLLNRASDPATHSKPKGAMLDSWAPANYVATGPQVSKFSGNTRDTYMAVLGIKKWPERTSPMLFETIAKLDMELTLCQVVRFLDAEQSTKEIEKAIEYHKLTQFGVVEHAFAQLAQKDATPKPGKAELMDLCESARTRIIADGLTYAYHNLTLFVYGESIRMLEHNVAIADRSLSNMRFGVVRERDNAMPSFAAMLPGQWAMQTRYELNSVENLADCAPIYTMDEGERLHPFFSKMIFRKDVPAFSVFGNAYGGRYYFSPHVGQLGHMAIIAPSRGGKTTWVNFVLSQFQRYRDVNTFIFDRNYSCMVTSVLHGGRHIDLKAKSAKFNPCMAMMDGSADGQNWLRDWILRRMEQGGYKATTDDRAELDMALESVRQAFERSRTVIRLSTIAARLPTKLTAELGEWLEGRPYGIFDSEEDDFSVERWTCIEMKEILANERMASAFIDYAFRKIYEKLDGTPAVIYLEEASFLLQNEQFMKMIDEWLKTFAKKNAFLWLTMQSPESISHSEIAASMLDNISSFLLLHNEKLEAHRDSYRKNFAFDDHIIDQIATLRPRKDYLLVQSGKARRMTTNFSPETMAFLRSEAAVLNTFERHKKSGDRNWLDKYLAEVATM